MRYPDRSADPADVYKTAAYNVEQERRDRARSPAERVSGKARGARGKEANGFVSQRSVQRV
jgi:hypothetical protein